MQLNIYLFLVILSIRTEKESKIFEFNTKEEGTYCH